MIRQLYGTLINNSYVENLRNINLDNIYSLEEIFSKYALQNEGIWIKRYNPYFSFGDLNRIGEFDFKILFDTAKEIKYGSAETSSYPKFVGSVYQFGHSGKLREFFRSISKARIYSINLSKLKEPYPLRPQDSTIDADGSNLVSFIDTMKDKFDEVMGSINMGLKDCIKEFRSISLDNVELDKDHVLKKLHGDKTFKKLGVKDKFGQIYWADELSDGTLYFLALLAIIHQPEPPKLLMIEEPENGIHPRRIKEIIDYFFNIAEEKGIQVILTTHSTVVIDQFKDLPESIFVFDKKGQATTVRNLLTDIIAEDKIISEKKHLPPLDLSGSLGDHWAAGLIGGVPR
jgi:predicted ATPase